MVTPIINEVRQVSFRSMGLWLLLVTPTYTAREMSAQMWADKEVAMLLIAWEDERSQEQLDRMPSQTQKGPSVVFHYSWHAPSIYTQTSRGGLVPFTCVTWLQKWATGTHVHWAQCVPHALCKHCVPRWPRDCPKFVRTCKHSLILQQKYLASTCK